MKKSINRIPTAFLVFLITFTTSNLFSQGQNVIFDTLLFENLANGLDADIKMPSGNDQKWVLYDEDGFPQNCTGQVTYGFYVDFDWGKDTTNEIIASCSYTEEGNTGECGSKKNMNWMILPPQFISGNSIELGWKSAPYHGPMWMDGYKVLISTSGNLPENFTDTLFVAGATLNSPNPPLFSGGLLLQNYNFSEGYLHANSFSDNAYFQQTVLNGLPIYKGYLEPHSVDLSAYKDQLVYVAFLHDTYCNYSIEFDDIYLRESEMVSNYAPATEIKSMTIFPNPSVVNATLNFSLTRKSNLDFSILDSRGKLIQHRGLGEKPSGNYQIPLEIMNVPDGIYYVHVRTDTGSKSSKLLVQH